MATFSCDSDSNDSSDHAGEIRGGSDAEPAIGTLAPHDVPYAGIGVDGSSLDLPSAGVEGEGDSTKGEGDETGNSMGEARRKRRRKRRTRRRRRTMRKRRRRRRSRRMRRRSRIWRC